MKLITVEAKIASADMEQAVGLFAEYADTVRDMDGCCHYAIFRKPSNDGVAIIQQWETMAAFDAYRSSESFSKLGQGLRPLLVAAPMTVIAEVDRQ